MIHPGVESGGSQMEWWRKPDGIAAVAGWNGDISRFPDVIHPGGMCPDETIASYPDMFFGCPSMVYPDALSGYTPCILDSKELSSISDCFGDQKAIKTPKLNIL